MSCSRKVRTGILAQTDESAPGMQGRAGVLLLRDLRSISGE